MTNNSGIAKLVFSAMKGLIFGITFLLVWLVSGVHLGFWGILIFAGIVLFPILQSKIPLTARLPSVKTVVVVIVILIIFAAIGYGISILLQKNPTWEFSEGEGWKGLTHSSGARIENGFLILAPGAYVKYDLYSGNGIATFELENVKLHGSCFEGSIKDNTGLGNSAIFIVKPQDEEICAKIIFPYFISGGGFMEQGASKEKSFSTPHPLYIKGNAGSAGIRLLVNIGHSVFTNFPAAAKSDDFSLTLKNSGGDGEIWIDRMVLGNFY